jgi:hypothetical protein
MSDAHRAAEKLASGPYELADLVAAIIRPLERRMRGYPPELVFECVIETYRLEGRAIAEGATDADLAVLFLEPFRRAQLDGKIAADVDLVRLALVAQTLVAEGIRRWSSSGFADKNLARTLANEIAGLAGDSERGKVA